MQPQEFKKFSAIAAALIFATTNSFGAVVDISDAPLVASISDPVRPNVYFIFDDSSSMPRAFMPDNIPGTSTLLDTNDDKSCFRNIGYNSIYYNPSTSYSPPPGKGDSSFTNARNDGFSGAATTNLSTATPGGNVTVSNTSFTTTNGSNAVRITRNSHGLQSGDIVRFTNTPTSGTLRNIPWSSITGPYLIVTRTGSNTFEVHPGTTNANSGGNASGIGGSARYNEITLNSYYTVHRTSPGSPPNTCDGNGLYEIRTATSHQALGRTVAQEQLNFANWFTYYSNRLKLMKTASGQAFASVSDKYRVGFSTTSETGADTDRFLGNATFTGAHKVAWYNLLYGVSGNVNATPLRGALSKAGRYYAGKLGGAVDPIQYACQRNFAILTTDGFWNTFNESSSYGPYKEDGSTLVGDQDSGNGVERPFRDGAGTHSNTLADVAMYYYNTDLRHSDNSNTTGGPTDEGGSVDVDEVTVTATTSIYQKQNMYTFTLGLGVTDSLVYPTDLPPVGAPGRAASPIMQGTKSWPDPDVENDGTTVTGRTDDLWHAAENGRGRYISASNADAVVTGLNEALEAIEATVGSSAAAATSTLQPVQDDNTAYVAEFETVTWTGNLKARSINLGTGAFEGLLWEAKSVIDAQYSSGASAAIASRKIYTFNPAVDDADKLRNFDTTDLTNAEKAANFSADTTTANGLINYLRGDATLEGTTYRNRVALLGDIVNAAPVFARKPPFAYLDAGYTAFAAANANRASTVYVGANDGMLHAINGDNGQERWAYIPSFVLPNLAALASTDYSTNHKFYVDGPITIGDVKDGSDWKTVLVSGLGKGGKGYFALDITVPGTPKALWEFGTTEDGTGDADLGFSFGNPMITKRMQDGRWVVIFSSGYNNTGLGRIYVVDAITGVKLDEYVTNATNDPDVSGIGRASNLVPNGLQDNTTQYVYAGDLGGSLWRFDITADSTAAVSVGEPSNGVVKLGQTHATVGSQPITVRPELSRLQSGGVTYTVIYFGTGRFLGRHDVGDSLDDHVSTRTAQAIYAVKDTGEDLGILRDSDDSALFEKTLVVNDPPLLAGQKPRETAAGQVQWASDNGWFFEVPEGERFNVNPTLQTGVIVMASNIVVADNSDRCNPLGASVRYEINYSTGQVMDSAIIPSMTVGVTVLKLSGGVVSTSVQADGSTITDPLEVPSDPAGTAIRISWREIE